MENAVGVGDIPYAIDDLYASIPNCKRTSYGQA